MGVSSDPSLVNSKRKRGGPGQAGFEVVLESFDGRLSLQLPTAGSSCGDGGGMIS